MSERPPSQEERRLLSTDESEIAVVPDAQRKAWEPKGTGYSREDFERDRRQRAGEPPTIERVIREAWTAGARDRNADWKEWWLAHRDSVLTVLGQRAGEPPTPIIGDEIRLLRALRDFRGLMFFDRLVERGLVKEWPSGYEITADGRAALDAARQEDDRG